MAEDTQDQVEQGAVEWPYPIRYDVENEVSADVIILGGGIAGCWAAISAAKKGARVAIIEKGATIRSGSGGAGVDHWQHACTNPRSKVTPEEMTEGCMQMYGGFDCGITRYVTCTESYDAILELEQMGLKIRDSEDEFKGAEFRDEETKLLYAYEYENKHCIRLWGSQVKPVLYKECKRLGVEIYDRVMVTSLLTEGGKQGSRVVGVTGLNVRTGEFYIFQAKAAVSCMSAAERLWTFSTELRGFDSVFFCPNNTGEGYSLGWRAGAEYAMMEKTRPDSAFGYPDYGTGNPDNTWYAATIVDANGKEIPWVNRDGTELKTVSERYRPAPGQKFFIMGGGLTETHFLLGTPHPDWYKYRGPCLTPDLPERIAKGEFELPLYADLPSMPEHERRAIFGLMVSQEGKTLIPIYHHYTQAGFDPDKDLLQVPVFPNLESYMNPCYWFGASTPNLRGAAFCSGGGVVVDWDLKSNLDGYYAAGSQALGGSEHSRAACTGRYVGRTAAEYALKAAPEPAVERSQVDEEKARVYGPTKRKKGIEWKQLNAGIGRIMQDHCGEYKNDGTLKLGLTRLKEAWESEATEAFARNPHELMRVLECFSIMTVGEMTIHASLARKASSFFLNFRRLDYPEVDPEEWNKFTTIKAEEGDVKYGELPFNYWLSGSYASTYEENYKAHCSL